MHVYICRMWWQNTPEDDATQQALWQAILLVILPGLVGVMALIYFVSPPYKPPQQSWADGTYDNPCCAPLIARGGLISQGNRAVRYHVIESKPGYQLRVDSGIGVRNGAVRFEGSTVFVSFNRNSDALPALDDAYAMHLWGLDDFQDYVFRKRCVPNAVCNKDKPV